MTDATDELGTTLIAAGFARNSLLLNMNGSLSVPADFPLEAPWNLPSRLFEFPIEVVRPEGDSPRKIGLMHPRLADHPFVQHVERTLGITIAREGVTNCHGFSNRRHALWWHAVDLISAGKWRELLDTQPFTEPRCILRAVAFGLRHSPHTAREGRGYINTSQAREIVREMGGCEPDDPNAIIRSFLTPSLCKPDHGSAYWPINAPHGLCAEDEAWAMIHGIEDGWFAHDRSGFLHWTEQGRARHAAGDNVSFTETSGQTAFAF